jgi:hypothetical protein
VFTSVGHKEAANQIKESSATKERACLIEIKLSQVFSNVFDEVNDIESAEEANKQREK